MKVDRFLLLISICISGLISYLFRVLASAEVKEPISAGAFLSFFPAMAGMIAFSFPYNRTTILARTVSSLFVLPSVMVNILFLNSHIYNSVYFILIAATIIVQTLLVYSIAQTKH